MDSTYNWWQQAHTFFLLTMHLLHFFCHLLHSLADHVDISQAKSQYIGHLKTEVAEILYPTIFSQKCLQRFVTICEWVISREGARHSHKKLPKSKSIQISRAPSVCLNKGTISKQIFCKTKKVARQLPHFDFKNTSRKWPSTKAEAEVAAKISCIWWHTALWRSL